MTPKKIMEQSRHRSLEICPRPLPLWLGDADRRDNLIPHNEGESPSAERRTPEILLVDDDAVLLENLAELVRLRIPQARVVTCLSGVAALALVTTSDFDAIITDVRMPEMDGLRLITELRQRRVTAPIIVLTGHGDRHLHTKAIEFGAFDFLQKPLNRDVFIASLKRALVLRSSREQGTA